MSAMAHRETVAFEAEGVRIAGSQIAAGDPEAPLLVCLHGGLYRGHYFDVGTGSGGSFMDVAAAHGFPVVALDRPGYGESDELPAADNTFERQAQLLEQAATAAAAQLGAPGMILVGHSIGGMIALTLAAQAGDDTPLRGVSATGMGLVIPSGGPAEGLSAVASAQATDTIAFPPEQGDQVMFGPPWSYDAAVLPDAHKSYAPAPAVELMAAPLWSTEKLPDLAPRVRVPIHNALAEFDALWDSSPENVAGFAALFTAAPFVDASVARGTGHSIDHHRLGRALHLRQLAFADECRVYAGRED
jgi:pimeloyl-ACP methyl ester carboxylesterase